MTAVVADDEPEIRELIKEYLVDRGFDVTPAADGLEALLHVKRMQPDLVVLDLMMPRLGGIDALAHIRRWFPDVAVIVLTGTPDDELRGRVVSLGAAALLPKPLDLDLLGMMIGAVTSLRVEAPRREPETKVAVPRTLEKASARVLVVDDDEEVRSVLRDFLEHARYQAVLTPDGVTALRSIADAPPQIVLLDIQMPGLSGIEALAAIRAVAPATRVIMISGIEDVELARRALSYGAFDYVKKPLDLPYLQRSIEAAINLAL